MLPEPTSYGSAGWLIVALAALVVIARNVIGFWREISRPNGADAIAQADTRYQVRGDYVSREEFEEKLNSLGREVHALRGEITDLERRVVQAGEDRAGAIHRRLDTMPNQIIAQLSNLGVLRRPEHP